MRRMTLVVVGVCAIGGNPATAQQSSGSTDANRFGNYAPDPDPSFKQGALDRSNWEGWFNSLPGNERNGADFWASRRNLARPGQCNGSDNPAGQDYNFGCREAQRRLGPIDARRRSDPQYRLGWNTYQPAQPPDTETTQEATAPTATPEPPVTPRTQQQLQQNDEPHDLGIMGSFVVVTLILLAMAAFVRKTIVSDTQGNVQRRSGSSSGVLSGLLGCVFGTLGVISIGVVFVPLAAICSLVGILRGAAGGSIAGLAISVIGVGLTVAGFVFSPSLWLLFGLGAAIASH